MATDSATLRRATFGDHRLTWVSLVMSSSANITARSRSRPKRAGLLQPAVQSGRCVDGAHHFARDGDADSTEQGRFSSLHLSPTAGDF